MNKRLKINRLIKILINSLYDYFYDFILYSKNNSSPYKSYKILSKILLITKKKNILYKDYKKELSNIKTILKDDVITIYDKDPSCYSLLEIVLSYKTLLALTMFRYSHFVIKIDKVTSRVISEFIHTITSIDINPCAIIGNKFFIDHGDGVVIGETTIIGNNVSIYQGVTLGARTLSTTLRHSKRHPVISDNVTIYANATILGENTIIKNNEVIKTNSLIYN